MAKNNIFDFEYLKYGLKILIFNKKAIEFIKKNKFSFWSGLGFFIFFISLLFNNLTYGNELNSIYLKILYNLLYIVLFCFMIHYIYSLLKGNEKFVNMLKVLGFAFIFTIFIFIINQLLSGIIASILYAMVGIYLTILLFYIFNKVYKIKLWKVILGFIIITIIMYIFSTFYLHLSIQIFGENIKILMAG